MSLGSCSKFPLLDTLGEWGAADPSMGHSGTSSRGDTGPKTLVVEDGHRDQNVLGFCALDEYKDNPGVLYGLAHKIGETHWCSGSERWGGSGPMWRMMMYLEVASPANKLHSEEQHVDS